MADCEKINLFLTFKIFLFFSNLKWSFCLFGKCKLGNKYTHTYTRFPHTQGHWLSDSGDGKKKNNDNNIWWVTQSQLKSIKIIKTSWLKRRYITYLLNEESTPLNGLKRECHLTRIKIEYLSTWSVPESSRTKEVEHLACEVFNLFNEQSRPPYLATLKTNNEHWITNQYWVRGRFGAATGAVGRENSN